jgi:hypothetical protein
MSQRTEMNAYLAVYNGQSREEFLQWLSAGDDVNRHGGMSLQEILAWGASLGVGEQRSRKPV